MWRSLTKQLWPVTPEGLLQLDETILRSCGLSRQKSSYARGIAKALLEGNICLDVIETMPDAEAIAHLHKRKALAGGAPASI